MVVLDDQSIDLTGDDADAAGFHRSTFGVVQVVGVHEERDVDRPLTDELRVRAGGGVRAEHAEPPVAHLPSVAVRAVQHVASPALADAREFGEVVDEPGREDLPSDNVRRRP